MAVRIRVAQGDIATFAGDAVVNAANNHLRMGAGVAGALARRGGPAIQRECDAYVRREGPLRVGEAAVTGGGDLPAGAVVHAAAMGDEPATERSIRSSTEHALRLASEHGFQRVAFPVLGSGVAGFPFQRAARLMLDAVRKHGRGHDVPSEVVFYGYTRDDAEALERLVDEGG